MGASPSGDLVYFWSNDPLTDGASGPGVYRYKLLGGAHGELTRLTGDPGPDGLGMKTVRKDPLFLPSNDGSTLYFVATAALAAGATAGQPNAYVWRGGQLRFVRTLAGDGAVQRVSRTAGSRCSARPPRSTAHRTADARRSTSTTRTAARSRVRRAEPRDAQRR